MRTRSRSGDTSSSSEFARSPERGFTLIELLVVVVILGILIAIAIPVYLNYRKTANDKAAQSDLRGVVTVLEQCYGDNSVYPSTTTFTAGATAGASGVACTGRPGTVSAGTTFQYFTNADSSAYILGAVNTGGTKTYCYNSAKGGSVASTSTAVTAYRSPCGP